MKVEVLNIPYEIYYINNPIWVEVVNLQNFDKVDLEIFDVNNSNNTYSLTFDVFNDTVIFDLAIIVKAMMELPRYDQRFESAGLNLNRIRLQMNFSAYQIGDEPTLIQQLARSFIRGGLYAGNNINVQDGAELIESEKVPVWNGFPSMFAEIVGTEIEVSNLPPSDKRVLMKQIGCNPIYLGWLNSKGGYSFWLFENWNATLKTDKADTLDFYRQGHLSQNFMSLGNESTYNLSVETRVAREFYFHLKSLVNSPDVWVFNSEPIMQYFGNINQNMPPITASGWMRIHNNGNSFNWNGHEEVKEVSFDFDFIKSENRQVIW